MAVLRTEFKRGGGGGSVLDPAHTNKLTCAAAAAHIKIISIQTNLYHLCRVRMVVVVAAFDRQPKITGKEGVSIPLRAGAQKNRFSGTIVTLVYTLVVVARRKDPPPLSEEAEIKWR